MLETIFTVLYNFLSSLVKLTYGTHTYPTSFYMVVGLYIFAVIRVCFFYTPEFTTIEEDKDTSKEKECTQ